MRHRRFGLAPAIEYWWSVEKYTRGRRRFVVLSCADLFRSYWDNGEAGSTF